MNTRTRRSFVAAAAGALAFRAAGADSRDLTGLTLKKASELLRSKEVSPVDLTQACLNRIEKLNPMVNAFITITRDQALATAREMEAEIRRGKWRGPLHGVPIALKDNIDTAGIRTTGASDLFRDRVPAEDAEVVRRLKNAGAVLLGKLNLNEFAFGGNPNATAFGATHNPWALDHTTGGSSAGPGAAMAADLCFGSLGTDTAGSVRIPASYCGVVGFKPTYGRVSMRGVIPLSWTLDHVGPLTKTVEDAALMLGIIAGYDEQDTTTVDMPVPDYARALKMPVSKLRLGIPRSPFYDRLDPEVAKAMEEATGVLRKLTASAADVKLPTSVVLGQVWGAEIWEYHGKYITETPEKYQPTVRATIQATANSKAADYVRARQQVDRNRREIKKVFESVDILITATMPAPAPPITPAAGGRGGGAPNNTQAFDAFGVPAISIPCGFSASGLPIGLQIVGAPWAELSVLSLAHAYEQATEWHKRRPKI